jgi:hypothetical protein
VKYTQSSPKCALVLLVVCTLKCHSAGEAVLDPYPRPFGGRYHIHLSRPLAAPRAEKRTRLYSRATDKTFKASENHSLSLEPPREIPVYKILKL